MSKELIPLEVSKHLKDFVLEFVENGLDRRFIHGSFDIIETALKEYETRKTLIETIDSGEMVFQERTVWEEKQKKLKALEIIKNKEVDIGWFIECLSCSKPLEVYNDRYDKIRSCDGKDYHFMQLTQQEYDLLKEVLL